MKATGVVRRIDELGRIVIPKEIRKTLRIREGENLEIFIDNSENIVLRKYSTMNKIGDFAQAFTDSIYSFLKANIIITDHDDIIAASGPMKKEWISKPISEQLQQAIKHRDDMLESHEKNVQIIEGKELLGTFAISSIIAGGDVAGLVVIVSSDSKVGETEERIAKIASQFLAKYLED